MMEDWQSDLLSEKSLGEVYQKSKKLPKSHANKLIYRVTLCAAIYIMGMWLLYNDASSSAKTVLNIAEICFSISVAILGFLVTGFSIFIGLSNDPLMIKIAKIKMRDEEVSIFKDMFFNFLSVFYIYLRVLVISVAIKVVPGLGFAEYLATYNSVFVATVINCIAFSFIVFNLVLSLVRLKSFVWNLYQAYITLIITRSKLPND
jgi:hypothetical protein